MQKIKFQYLYGINPVLSALTANKRIFSDLYIAEPVLEKSNILSLASSLNLRHTLSSKETIEKFARNKPHQGVILKASELSPLTIEDPSEIPMTHNSLWLCLDQITDPQNLGSILRVAYFFNVNGVILPSKNSAPLTPAVAKVSSGALEWVNVCMVDDLPGFLGGMKRIDWKIVGAGVGKDVREMKREKNMVVVFGNEGNGIRGKVKQICDELFWIQGGGETVDSLNVASAVSVFLHSLQ